MRTQKTSPLIINMECDIIDYCQKALGKNLITLLVEGSYGNLDFIEKYSDYDLIAFVKNTDIVPILDFDKLSKKHCIEIKCAIRLFDDFQRRVWNDKKATRFVGNIDLIKLKHRAKILLGRDILSLIPNDKILFARNLNTELQADYLHATNNDPEKNIFMREPKNWISYIINMSDNLLICRNIFVKKNFIPENLKKYVPEFGRTDVVQEALELRKTRRVLSLENTEKKSLKKKLELFLEEYRKSVF